MGKGQFPSETLQGLDALFDLGREEPLEVRLGHVVDLALQAIPPASHTSLTTGEEPLTPIVCTDATAKELDEAQYEAGSGPCLEAFRRGETVKVPDLCADDRWPRFAEEARRRGVHASLSLPLRTRAGTVGSLNLYSDDRAGFRIIDEEIGSMIASWAAVGMTNSELFEETKQVGEQLREALASRDVIGQAKGIIMANEGCSDEEAFRMLVTASQHSNRKLREIAKAILDEHNRHISEKV